jgi:O-acetylserine/cysteine efflux transporter
MRPLDWAAAFTVIFIWALNFVVAKVGVSEFPPLFLLALRFALVAVLLAPFLKPLYGAWKPMLALSVVLGGLHFGLLFVGLQEVDAGPAAIAIQLAVPFSAILAWIVYRERMGAWQITGLVIAFTGVYALAGDPARSPDPMYFGLVVAGALAWACANILIKRLVAVRPIVVNAWLALMATPQLFAMSALLETGQLRAVAEAGWRGWGAIGYMAVAASIIAYGLWYYLIGKYEMNRVVPLTLLAPVLAVFLAAAILEEPLTLNIVIGGAVTITGVAMIQFLKPGARKPAGKPPVPS